MGVAVEEGDRAVLPHLHSRWTSWLCWLGPSVPEPSRGILASTGGLLFLLRPSPTPSCRDYTHLQLSMRGSLPGRRPAPGHPHAARRTAWQGSWSSLCSSSCCSVYPQPHPGKSLVVFWFLFLDIFSPQGPCLYLQPLGGRRAGGSPDSNRLRVNVRDPWGRSSLGDCWAVRGRPEETSVLSGGRGALEGYNSLEEIWPFLLLLRWAGPLLQSVHPWDSSLRKIHRCTELQVQGFTAAKSKSVQRATIRELCE